VLDGRLRDARFFWQSDRRKSLSQHAWSLSGIAFQKELGSMADKVARVGTAAFAVARELGLSEAERAVLERALPVFRADLATEMVAELPELEGTMARAYALAEGQPHEVAVALEDGVLPRGPHDALPATRVGAVLAVSDRLDKLLGFFALGKRPSGSADPYALRRDAVAVARVAAAQGWPVPSTTSRRRWPRGTPVGPPRSTRPWWPTSRPSCTTAPPPSSPRRALPIRTVRAATAGNRPLVAAARRAHLLHALSGQPAFAEMLALYKRAANLAERATPERRSRPAPVPGPGRDAAPRGAAGGPPRGGAAARGDGRAAAGLGPRHGPTGSLHGLDELAVDVVAAEGAARRLLRRGDGHGRRRRAPRQPLGAPGGRRGDAAGARRAGAPGG
jgi:glycyl-tRNA synthetase beta chain